MVAAAGPPFDTSTVYVSGAPATAGAGDALCTTPRLASAGLNSQFTTAPPDVVLRLVPSPGSDALTSITSGVPSLAVSFARM